VFGVKSWAQYSKSITMDMGRRDLDVGSNNYVIVEIMQVNNMLELVHVEVLIVEVKWSV
jgi:hypothetical protein